MSSRVTVSERAGRSWIQIQLLALVLLLGAAFGARAQSANCSDFGGVLDGSVAGAPNPSQLNIDVDVCTVRNYPASAYPPPLGFIANLNFEPGPQRLVIFDNVYWSGNIACNAVQGHKIWFVNGSVHTIRPECQNVLIPVESINKTGPAYAAVGVPFTYRLLIPVLIDPQTGTVVANGTSQNDLHGITLYDNLGAAPVTVFVNGPDDNDPSTPLVTASRHYSRYGSRSHPRGNSERPLVRESRVHHAGRVRDTDIFQRERPAHVRFRRLVHPSQG